MRRSERLKPEVDDEAVLRRRGGLTVELGLAGKVAVVIGASRGLGRAAAEELAREGCTVVLTARDADAVALAADRLRGQGLSASALAADVTRPDQVRALFDRVRADVGVPQVLVYGTSGPRDRWIGEAAEEDFVHANAILVLGLTSCIAAVVPGMRELGWGRVVTLGSLCVREPHRVPPLVLHNVARAAQVALNKTYANELARDGITVNTIATGMMEDHDGQAAQRAYEGASRLGLDAEQVQAHRLGAVPAKRTGRAEELGALCAFLASDRAGYINGQTILLDGGRVASLT